ncbi:MAG: InlB B-repeat-containing protein, partial [Oscillospiraceae bacterium]|nr:InlB B-repeat-containing protein [Oscillospiraceae bacterium]
MNLVELTYDANGGTGGPHLVGSSVNAWIRADSVHTVLTCSAADITAPPGYGFAGWNTAADGSGRFYAAGSEIALDDTIPLDGNITLFAQWARHTVTFDLDGGAYSGNQALLVQTVPHGQNATALSVNPTRNGYTFTGWAPALNLTNVTENRTFVAQWTPGVNHTVTFALNGGTYNGNQALLVQTVPHGQNATALSGNPSRPGF